MIASMEERGLDGEQAQIEAFYAVQKKLRRGNIWARSTGFMDYKRKTSADIPPLERIGQL